MNALGPKRILVVALDNLGDAVMASAVLAPLKRFFPQARTGLWVKNYASGLFTDHSQIDNLHASDPFWDKSPGVGKGGLGRFLLALNEIRRQHYDAALVLNSEWRRAFACALAGIPVRAGYRRRQSSPFLTDAYPASVTDQHFVDDHRQLVENWARVNVGEQDCLPRLEMTAQDEREWESWSKEHNLASRGYTVLHLFSGDENKNWPVSCFVELTEARLAKNSSERFVFLCGPGEEHKIAMFRGRMSRPGNVFLVAPSLSRLKGVIGHARLVVGGDSGPGHVAAALGAPLISLFGSTNPARSRPLGRNTVKVLQYTPLRDLRVPVVLEAMESL